MPEETQQSYELKSHHIEPDYAMAGVRDTWLVTFSGLSLPEGGVVRLRLGGGRDNKTDWTPPQSDDPSANEYVTAECSGEAELRLETPPWEQVSDIVVDMTITGAPLAETDEITVTLGDTSGGGEGSTPQTFSRPDKPFDVFVALPPAKGEELQFVRVQGAPALDVTGAPMDRVRVFAPPTVPAGKKFAITIKAEDRYGNVASGYVGRLDLHISADNVTGPESAEMRESDESVIRVPGFKAHGRGLVRITATDTVSDIQYVSNPLLVTKHDEPQLYWGIIHGHTERSDGIGTVESYFECMRDHNGLDFGAVGDHDHEWETTDEDWAEIQRLTAEYNEPGRFVTLLGYEWAKWRKNGDGDRNVYYAEDYQPMYRSGDDFYPSPPDLFAALKDHRAIVIPHHPASAGNFCDYKDHDPEKERLVEIYSVWGNSERSAQEGNPFPMRPPRLPRSGFAEVPLDSGEVAAGFVQRALAMGRRLGFVGGGDDHLGHPGDRTATGAEPFRYRDGLMAVWAPELTREAIFQSMYERRTYATTGARIIVLFSVAGKPMGGELDLADQPELADRRVINVFVSGEAKIAQVEVVRNNAVVYEQRGESAELELTWTDEEPLEPLALTPVDPEAPKFVFYYLRILQADGEMAWASPVWITVGNGR